MRDRYGFAQRREYRCEPGGYSPAMWAQFAELGMLAAPFAEADGGLGLGSVETMIAMEAIGRALVVEPYVATVVLAGGILRRGASAAQRARWVPAIAAGAQRWAFAHGESGARYDLAHVAVRAEATVGGYRLHGAKTLVVHGDSADWLVVSARLGGGVAEAEGIGLFAVAADAVGVHRVGYPTQDGQRAAEIALRGAYVAAADVIGVAGAGSAVIQRVVAEAIAALCAEAVGAMAALHALTVDYLKTRRQFGVPIGSFQAVQHRAADMLIALEQARSMALYATALSGSDDAEAGMRAAREAKVQIGHAARFIGQQAVQLHGGIGITEEYQVAHYFARLTMIDMSFGDAAHHIGQLSACGTRGVAS